MTDPDFVCSMGKFEEICSSLVAKDSVYGSVCLVETDVLGRKEQIEQLNVNTTHCFSGPHPVHGMSLRTNDDDEDLVCVNTSAFYIPMTALSGTMVRSSECLSNIHNISIIPIFTIQNPKPVWIFNFGMKYEGPYH
ncbi:hypothetical protein BsWGS_08918 [Bradybaena similaris]